MISPVVNVDLHLVKKLKAPCLNYLSQNRNFSNIIPGCLSSPKTYQSVFQERAWGCQKDTQKVTKRTPKRTNRILGGSHILRSGMAQCPRGMAQVWRTPVSVMLQPNMTTRIGFYTRNITFTKEITTLWPQMYENTMVFWNSNIGNLTFTKEIVTSWSQRRDKIQVFMRVEHRKLQFRKGH